MAAAEVAAHEGHAEGVQKDELVIKLDELLEQYLKTLDAYEQAQQKLTSHLSAGYFTLAQANFNNAARTRYGQDYYDERMQALRKVTVTDTGAKVTFSVDAPAPDEPSDGTRKAVAVDKEATDPTADTVPACFETATTPKIEKSVDASAKDVPSPPDPIRWFGILVPQPLRSAQSSFVSAVEGPLPQLANLARDLRQQEIDIGRLRKQFKKL
ncbi:hypothetical protein CC80DRAFT_468188 [Byssothecium circinans]|uniref:Vacuolar ATPase assembly protein VMA22 n=1 Tax=Byssothecium circinans TaxID=147558 RepID=A0A6A5U6L7_9PLEO|nr:hypothetical protein CC80DRAFT_468188 [Byssothecium circinans]